MSDIPANNQPAPGVTDPAKQCDNCGQPFGKLESPLIWETKNYVCSACHQKLTYKKRQEITHPTGPKVSTIFLVIGLLGLLPSICIDDTKHNQSIIILFSILGSLFVFFGLTCKAVAQGISEQQRPKY